MNISSPSLPAKKILITENDGIAEEAIRMLQLSGYDPVSSVQNTEKEDIQGLFVRTYTQVNSKYLDEFPNLKFILRAGVGLDNIDLDECSSRKITVLNSPGSNSNAVAEYVILAMLLMLRMIPQQIDQVKSNNGRNKCYEGQELEGKTIGLIGCGAIGKSLAKKLQSFNISLLGYDPYVDSETLSNYFIKKSSLENLLRKADVISLQIPLTEETKGIINRESLSKMKESSVLINVSRGDVVQEQDLLWALKNKVISGAVLDVWKNEPVINPEFLEIPNLIVTPHVAAFTKEANIQMATGVVNNFLEIQKD